GELAECERHEALVNVAFDLPEPFQLLCPYDTSTLDDDVIEATFRTHPFVVQDGARQASRLWTDVASMAQPLLYDSLPAPPTGARVVRFFPQDLRKVRKLVTDLGERAGLPLALGADLALSAHELVVNSVHHGGGSGTLMGWYDNVSVTVEVQDQGIITDPLAGLRRPTAAQIGGRGLWLAGQLCDLIHIRRTQTGGAVRLQMNIPAPVAKSLRR
ncbi:MAG: ATP-binding protein, partial [Aquihabitans sp.]